MTLRTRLDRLEARRPPEPIAIEFQRRDETPAQFDERIRVTHDPSVKVIAFGIHDDQTQEVGPGTDTAVPMVKPSEP